jgi:hypothetical protein
VAGLDTVMFAGLMESIEWFFHLVRQGFNMPPNGPAKTSTRL